MGTWPPKPKKTKRSLSKAMQSLLHTSHVIKRVYKLGELVWLTHCQLHVVTGVTICVVLKFESFKWIIIFIPGSTVRQQPHILTTTTNNVFSNLIDNCWNMKMSALTHLYPIVVLWNILCKVFSKLRNQKCLENFQKILHKTTYMVKYVNMYKLYSLIPL